MDRLFGTDGIRGMANSYPITPEVGSRLGRAMVSFCNRQGLEPVFVIGRDTRISGEALERAIVSGILSSHGHVYSAGIFPTPGISFLVRDLGAGAGIVISASHNPYEYNGFKIFSHKGHKLSKKAEMEIENLIRAEEGGLHLPENSYQGRTYTVDDGEERYISFLRNSVSQKYFPEKMKVVLDCANGATYKIAPLLFRHLGADIEVLGAEPDGKNINHNCGSQHTDYLSHRVVALSANVGLAFDGDGDRLVAVDEKGFPLTGDHIMAICARMLKDRGDLKGNMVISTVMSNMGFRFALKKMGIMHMAAQVGDRNVFEEMMAHDVVLGGEESGHIIFLNHHTTGDGLLSALQLLSAMKRFEEPLSRLSGIMDIFPQVMINIPVTTKPDMATVPELVNIIKKVEQELGEKGRVLVRYSGTEPLCRVMVEGKEKKEVQGYARTIAEVVRKCIGSGS